MCLLLLLLVRRVTYTKFILEPNDFLSVVLGWSSSAITCFMMFGFGFVLFFGERTVTMVLTEQMDMTALMTGCWLRCTGRRRRSRWGSWS